MPFLSALFTPNLEEVCFGSDSYLILYVLETCVNKNLVKIIQAVGVILFLTWSVELP